jgi:hypothetical protein
MLCCLLQCVTMRQARWPADLQWLKAGLSTAGLLEGGGYDMHERPDILHVQHVQPWLVFCVTCLTVYLTRHDCC